MHTKSAYFGIIFAAFGSALRIIRKESGDVAFGLKACNHGESFVNERGRYCVVNTETIGCTLEYLNTTNRLPSVVKNTTALQIYLGEHFCVGGELIKIVYYWDNKNGTSTWKRLKDIKKINTFIRVHRNMKIAEKIDLTITKKLPGVLLKIGFGCKGKSTMRHWFKKGNCVVLKFPGVIIHPLSKSYFGDSHILSKQPISWRTENATLRKTATTLPIFLPHWLLAVNYTSNVSNVLVENRKKSNSNKTNSVHNQIIFHKVRNYEKKTIGMLAWVGTTTLVLVGMVFSYTSYQVLSNRKLDSDKETLQKKLSNFPTAYGYPADVAPLVHEIHSKVYCNFYENEDQQRAPLLKTSENLIKRDVM